MLDGAYLPSSLRLLRVRGAVGKFLLPTVALLTPVGRSEVV